jgi:uncharacterized cupredoxin-like copper-binding protein
MNRLMARVLLLAMFASVALAACGGSPGGPVTVNVTATEYKFESSRTIFSVGVPYHFVVTNKGTMEHEFMIIKPEPATTPSDQLDADALAHIEETDLQPGKTVTVDYTFTQPYATGTLEFACHLAGHYEQGMHLAITVQ